MDMTDSPSGRSALSAAFAEQMRAERAAARISQADLSKRTTISLSTIKRLEMNEREMDTDQLARICAALGVSIVDFVMRAEVRRGGHSAQGDMPAAR